MLADFAGAPNVMHVAQGGGPQTPRDGSSWAKAFATISEALAPDGTRSNVVVLIGPGTYAETLVVHGSNVTLIGAGAGTRIEFATAVNSPVVTMWGNCVAYEDLQIVNTLPDNGGHSANAIASSLFGSLQFLFFTTIRRCYLHGEAAIFMVGTKNVATLDSILSGYENAVIPGKAFGGFDAEYTSIMANCLFYVRPSRLTRPADGSPAVHSVRGAQTVINSSITSVAVPPLIPEPTVTETYTGVLNVHNSVTLFNCTLGARAVNGVKYPDSGGAKFYGIAAQDGPIINSPALTSVVGCAVRAVGKPAANVHAYIDIGANPSILSEHWTLTTNKVLPP